MSPTASAWARGFGGLHQPQFFGQQRGAAGQCAVIVGRAAHLLEERPDDIGLHERQDLDGGHVVHLAEDRDGRVGGQIGVSLGEGLEVLRLINGDFDDLVADFLAQRLDVGADLAEFLLLGRDPRGALVEKVGLLVEAGPLLLELVGEVLDLDGPEIPALFLLGGRGLEVGGRSQLEQREGGQLSGRWGRRRVGAGNKRLGATPDGLGTAELWEPH